MAREGLRFDLSTAFQKTLRQKELTVARGLKVGEGSETQTVDITVQVIEEPAALQGMVMIVFTDVAPPPAKKTAGRAKKSAAGSARTIE
jgi:two-component system CheB/CheR fusion protein